MSEIPPPPPYAPPPLLLEPPLGQPPTPPQAPQPPGPSQALVLVLAVIGVLIIAGVVVAATLFANEEPVSTDLDAVQVYDDLVPNHVEGDIDYPQTPPVGGPHDPVWLDCGVYDEPVRDENVVHDLEHGTVWITYVPELDGDEVDELAGVLPQNGILSPYAGQSSPVVITVWGRQLELTGPGDPRLALFVEEFGGGVTAPEPFASCAGGIKSADGQVGANA